MDIKDNRLSKKIRKVFVTFLNLTIFRLAKRKNSLKFNLLAYGIKNISLTKLLIKIT